MPVSRHLPQEALRELWASLRAVRHGPALWLLSATYAAAGLLLAMMQQSVGGERWGFALAYGVAMLAVAFYGGNAVGILLMDDARGRSRRAVADAVRQSLRTAHRLLGVIALVAATYAAGAGFLAVVLLMCRTPWLGPLLYTVVLPVAVVLCGLAWLALPAVIVPLAAPAVWNGLSTLAAMQRLYRLVRHRLLEVLLLMLLVGVLTSLVAAVVVFVILAGGQTLAAMSRQILGAEVPLAQWMAGLFGYGVRSLASAGVDLRGQPHALAALVGGGIVFVLSLVLPSLVYLRGACAVYLSQEGVDTGAGVDPASFADGATHPAPSAPGAAPAAGGRGGVLAAPDTAQMQTTIMMARPPVQAAGAMGVDLLLPLAERGTGIACAACQALMQPADRYCAACGARAPGAT